MARGDNKDRSRQHERYVASLYEGKASASSGAAPTDAGDVRTDCHLIECKTTGGPEKPARSTLVTRMEKIADEAWAEGKQPMVCLRFFMPDSVLANIDGFVDLTVSLTTDDALHYGYQTKPIQIS